MLILVAVIMRQKPAAFGFHAMIVGAATAWIKRIKELSMSNGNFSESSYKIMFIYIYIYIYTYIYISCRIYTYIQCVYLYTYNHIHAIYLCKSIFIHNRLRSPFALTAPDAPGRAASGRLGLRCGHGRLRGGHVEESAARGLRQGGRGSYQCWLYNHTG